MGEICGVFDISLFDSAIFDCRDVSEGWPTSVVSRTSVRHIPSVNSTEKKTSSITKTERKTSTVRTSEKKSSSTTKTRRYRSNVGTSEG